jgi:signal transduction histidine kinase
MMTNDSLHVGRSPFERQRVRGVDERDGDGIVASCARPPRADEQHGHACDEILAMISHDLKNPLNTILLGVQQFEASRDDKLLRVIERAANRMGRLIADLLDAQRMADGRLVLERTPTRARDAVDEVTMDFQLCDEIVLADRSRLVQVLANLIGNAVKFTPGHGHVSVTAKRHDMDVVFEVRDTGPGIPKEGLVHVFDRYWRASGTKPTGTGLGLYIAYRIVIAHGGRFWVESEVGAGTLFGFSIPAVIVELNSSSARGSDARGEA